MSTLLLCVTLLAVPAGAMQARSVTCPSAATGKETTVRVQRIKEALRALPRMLAKRRVHVLDLPEEALEHRRQLSRAFATGDWCAVRAHVNAIREALARLRIDQAFVAGKLDRVQGWVRAGLVAPASREEVEKLLAEAAAQLEHGRTKRANRQLGRVMGLLFGTDDPWALPASLPSTTDTGAAAEVVVEVEREQVAAACPALAKQGRASRDDLERVLRELRQSLDRRHLRPLDFKKGEELFAALASYDRLGAVWPATRVACVLLARARELEIGLGTVIKRLQHANRLRDEHPLPEADETHYKELARTATALLATRDFDEAYATTEEILVLVGEPALASAGLPR